MFSCYNSMVGGWRYCPEKEIPHLLVMAITDCASFPTRGRHCIYPHIIQCRPNMTESPGGQPPCPFAWSPGSLWYSQTRHVTHYSHVTPTAMWPVSLQRPLPDRVVVPPWSIILLLTTVTCHNALRCSSLLPKPMVSENWWICCARTVILSV